MGALRAMDHAGEDLGSGFFVVVVVVVALGALAAWFLWQHRARRGA